MRPGRIFIIYIGGGITREQRTNNDIMGVAVHTYHNITLSLRIELGHRYCINAQFVEKALSRAFSKQSIKQVVFMGGMVCISMKTYSMGKRLIYG